MLFNKSVVLLLFCSIVLSGSDDNVGNSDVGIDKAALLTNYADNIIIPAFEQIYTNALILEQTFDDLKEGYTESKLNKLQQSFKEVRKNWQYCSPFGFGPAEDLLLRQSINTFPTDTFRIKDNISIGDYNLTISSNFKAKGLPALDYLLFSVDYSEEEVQFTDAKRIKYIEDIIDDMLMNLKEVRDNWQTYREEFISRTGNDVGSSLSQMINEFIFDYEIAKNAKLAFPLGLRSSDILPYHFEAPYSQLSSFLLSDNLAAYRQIITGPDYNDETKTDNLYEYLNELSATRGDSLLADVILREFDETTTLFNKLDISFFRSVGLESEKAKIEAGYKNMQETTVLFKNDMTSALGIRITYQDNDGD